MLKVSKSQLSAGHEMLPSSWNLGEAPPPPVTPIDKILGWCQIKSEPSGLEEDLLPLPRIESRLLSRPGRSLVTVITELPLFPCAISCF
jgi:hypothetical protein